jgi:hypothetical protein
VVDGDKAADRFWAFRVQCGKERREPGGIGVHRNRKEEAMYRKILLIVAAIVGAGIAFAPTAASARGRGRGFGFGGAAIGLGIGLGLAGAGYYGRGYGYGYPAYGYGYGGPVYGYAPVAYGGCWRRTVVYTPYGPRSRRLWVC